MILVGAPIVIATVAGFLAIYVIAHVLAGRNVDEASKDLAGSVVLRISGLHGLVLGLVFAQLAGEMRQLQSSLVDEAAYVTQIHRNAGLHGGPGSPEIRDATLTYIMAVTGPELDALRQRQEVDSEAGQAMIQMSDLALVLSDDTSATATLREAILSDVRSLAQLHRLRTQPAMGSGGEAFWFAALAGLALMSIGYLAFPISSRSVLLISLLGAYNGIILFLIYSFSSPFSPPGAIDMTPLEKARTVIASSV